MINRERVRRMTQLAIYEQGRGVGDERICRFYRTDYISGQILASFFCATLLFLAAGALWLVYNFEDLMLEVYSDGLQNIVWMLFRRYVVFTAAFLVLTFIISFVRHKRASDSLRAYRQGLGELAESYRLEDEAR